MKEYMKPALSIALDTYGQSGMWPLALRSAVAPEGDHTLDEALGMDWAATLSEMVVRHGDGWEQGRKGAEAMMLLRSMFISEAGGRLIKALREGSTYRLMTAKEIDYIVHFADYGLRRSEVTA